MNEPLYLVGEKINLRLEYSNFNDEEVDKLIKAAEHFIKAINSKEFKNFILNFGYESKICSGRFWNKKCVSVNIPNFKDNNDKSNMEIYNHLMTGKEVLSNDSDKEIDIEIILDRRNKKGVLGYTYANTTRQWIYNSFFRSGSIEDIAGNIAHEWTHKMGYTHDFRYTPTREYSVPYAVGYFVRDYVVV